MTRFPDIEKAVMELLEPHGDVYLRLPIGFEQVLIDGDAETVIQVADLGGVGSDKILRTDRVRIAVYATSRDSAYLTAETIRAVLLAGPHATDAGLLDRITPETEPVQMPYVSDRILLYQSVYRVDVRPVRETADA